MGSKFGVIMHSKISMKNLASDQYILRYAQALAGIFGSSPCILIVPWYAGYII